MDLLHKQQKLQGQAKRVLHELGLPEILSGYGEVNIVGSFALGLMTWPDIDIDLISDTYLYETDFLKIAGCFFGLEKVRKLVLIDNRNEFERSRPASMYLGIFYDLDGIAWKIDIRYLNISEATAKELAGSIQPKLNEDNVKSILEIKACFHDHPEYGEKFSAKDIYEAVIEKNISEAESFALYLKDTGRPVEI